MNEFYEQEVQRRVQQRLGQEKKLHNDEVVELHSIIRECQSQLIKQNLELQKLLSEPLYFATILEINNIPDATVFRKGDNVVVTNSASTHFTKAGKILGNVNEDTGYVLVKLSDDDETTTEFCIGTQDRRADIKLVSKDDGTNAVLLVDGNRWQVSGVGECNYKAGDCVKILEKTKQIVALGKHNTAGPICRVVSITSNGIEIEEKGDKRLVNNANQIPLEEGDRVVVDPAFSIITSKLPQDDRKKYRLSNDSQITWADIGGLKDVIQQMRNAIELPFQQPDLYAHYKMKKEAGILLYGPPGCGKTLIARAAANALATLHGKSCVESGYTYVKSPEILDKWVGNTEAEIRNLVERGRVHYRQHGYPAILAFDEFDAIAPQQGTRRSSDISDTIVPMFLGEMDGIDEQQTKENPIFLIMTNRADILDPAITRPGRISKHIKVNRPNVDTALDILEIHCREIPFDKPDMQLSILTVAIQDFFSKSRTIYRVNGQYDFTLGDTCSGAMLAGIAEEAKVNALHRDLTNRSKTGLILDDFRLGIEKIYRQQSGMNHSFDLMDFAEQHEIQAKDLKFERYFGAK
jgi:proteasome-associated ATPase